MPPPPPPPDPLLEDGEDWGDDNDDALLVAASQENPHALSSLFINSLNIGGIESRPVCLIDRT
jgi:hypothetical protein